MSDGAYLVGARGFNAQDQSGAGKTISVTLNRYAPTRPPSFAAGRNGSVGLEFDWTPSPDRDVTAYKVYKLVGGTPSTSDTLMCTRSVSDPAPTSCITADVNGTQKYYVVAVAPARSGSGSEETDRTTVQLVTVPNGNNAPNPPQNVVASRAEDVTTLSWNAPAAPAGGEAGDSVSFYRVYRDGQVVASRYGRSDKLSFVDYSTGGTAHSYWVTSVDTHMLESAQVGPVQG
jgi:hypothetical protein